MVAQLRFHCRFRFLRVRLGLGDNLEHDFFLNVTSHSAICDVNQNWVIESKTQMFRPIFLERDKRYNISKGKGELYIVYLTTC